MKKHVQLFTIICTVAALAVGMLALPAVAQGAATGTIAGRVINITPGLTTTPTDQTFEFQDTVITVVATLNGQNYAGTVNVTATGTDTGGLLSPDGATCALGGGTVDTLSFSGTDVEGNTLSGSGSGTFERQGSNVIVQLTGEATFNEGTPNEETGSGALRVEAEFIPTEGNCLDNAVNEAEFAGTFEANLE